MQQVLSQQVVRELIHRFDREWDLLPDYEGFQRAIQGLGIELEADGATAMAADCPALAVIIRCFVDMYDRQFDLGRAFALEPSLEAAIDTSLASWDEQRARAQDALGRLAYRRGSYMLAAERFQSAIDIAARGHVDYVLADLTSNGLRANFELQRLSAEASIGDLSEKYISALADAGWSDEFSRPLPANPSRQEILHQRGISNMLHNLALALRSVDPDAAERRHRQAEAINRALGDGYRLAQTQFNLARLYASRAKTDPHAHRQAEALLQSLAHNRAWPRGRCFALQNMATLYRDLGNTTQAEKLYEQAWQLYKRMVPDSARDIAFEEWTLLSWWDVASNDASRRALYSLASDALGAMRGNLRHVLFRRNYGQRASKLIEKGLPFAGCPRAQVTELGTWSAQEICDLPELVTAIDGFVANLDFAEFDQAVRRAIRTAKDAGRPQEHFGTLRIDTESWKHIGGPLQTRHLQYLRQIERSKLHVSAPSTPWDVDRLQACLPRDAAAALYFWPHAQGEERFVSAPRVYVITNDHVGVRELKDPATLIHRYRAKAAPDGQFRNAMFDVLVQPVLAEMESLDIRTLYLIPYGSLFGLPIHCAQQSAQQSSAPAPLLCNDPQFERVLYSASPRQLTTTLESKHFGDYGDLVDVAGRGLAIIDPAQDLGKKYQTVRDTINGMASLGRVQAYIGGDATYEALLSELASATWWAYAGHGYLPTEQDGTNRNRAEEAKIGAVLELAQGVVEDLDLLLRSGAKSLQMCILSACVSAGMNVSEGNELAGFIRALKARGCGPVVLAFWEVSDARAALILNGLLERIRDDAHQLHGFAALRNTVRALARDGARAMAPHITHSGMFGVYI